MNNATLINQTSGIYQIRNVVNGNLYVGSAVDLKRRKKDHWQALRRNKHHCQPLQRAWFKYGGDAFVFELIEACAPVALLTREQYYLELDRHVHLYNVLRRAYSHLGSKRGEEARARMRAACVGRKRPEPFTQEHRSKIGLAHRGRKFSPETIEKMRETGRRQIVSQEQRRFMAARRWSNPKPFRHSEESKRKISESRMGTRLKMSTAQKLAHAKKRNEPLSIS